MEPSPNPVLSIIIPVGGKNLFLRTLDSLRNQTCTEPFEVLVVLDGVSLQKPQTDSYSFQVKFLEQPRLGAASARNLGAKEARGELLVFLDDDIQASADLLNLHTKTHLYSTKKLLAFGPVVTDPSSPDTFLRRWMDLWKEQFFRECSRNGSIEPFYFCSANFSILKTLFLASGGFDIRFRGYGWEEADLGIRLKQAGFEFVYLEQAVGSELYTKSPKHAATVESYSKGKNEVLFVQNHPSFRCYSTIAEAFDEKCRIRVLIRLIWRLTSKLNWLPSTIPFAKKRFRVRSLIHFWSGVKDTGILWETLEQWFGRTTVAIGYHDIPHNPSRNWLDVSVSDFEKQMKFIKEKGYQPISFLQFVEWLDQGKEIPRKAVLITFDDGYKSFATSAAPILQRLHFPATVFVCPGFIGSENVWDHNKGLPEKKLLNKDEIKALCGEFKFDAHGYLHKDLVSISAEESKGEILLCKEKLMELGCDPICFSYPYGAFKEETIQTIKNAGFHCAITTEEGLNGILVNRYLLRRILITGKETLFHFRHKLATGKTFLGFWRTDFGNRSTPPQNLQLPQDG